jgi:hypothetical protein
VAGDVPIDSEAPVMISSISRICRLSLSEVLIEAGLLVRIHMGECACVLIHYCRMSFIFDICHVHYVGGVVRKLYVRREFLCSSLADRKNRD